MRVTAWNYRLADTMKANFTGVLSTARAIGNASTDCETIAFGFNASLLSVLNNGTQSIFLNVESTTVTNNDAEVMAGSRLELSFSESISQVSLYTASTGSSEQIVEILALGKI